MQNILALFFFGTYSRVDRIFACFIFWTSGVVFKSSRRGRKSVYKHSFARGNSALNRCGLLSRHLADDKTSVFKRDHDACCGDHSDLHHCFDFDAACQTKFCWRAFAGVFWSDSVSFVFCRT